MKWKKYKELTPEEKEEYNYRFKDDIELPATLSSVIMLYVMHTSLMVVSMYLIDKGYTSSVLTILETLPLLTVIFGWCYVIEGFAFIMRAMVRFYQEGKFLKKVKQKKEDMKNGRRKR